jgi:Spy/CpxP family protein refolding chaperone
MEREMKRMLGALAIVLALAAPAAAEPEKRAQVRQHIVEFAMQELTQQLGLDPPTAAQFREVTERYQAQIAALHQENGRTFKEIQRELAAPQPNGARLRALADLVVANRAKVQQLEAQRTAEHRRALTPAQFARLILVWPQINRQIRVEVWKAMHGGQAPPPGAEVE